MPADPPPVTAADPGTISAESHRRSEAALQSGEVGTYYWDIRADRLTGDRNFVSIFGVLRNERDSAPVGDLLNIIHPDDRERVGEQIRRTLEKGEPYLAEYRITSPAGERWVVAHGVVERGPDGAPEGWAGVVVDITGRKRAEDRLRASEERYRTLFDTIDEGFVVIEVEFDEAGRATDYRHVEANPAFERHTGLRGHLGLSVRQTVPGLEEFWFETYGRVVATGEPTRFEHRAGPLGGRWFDVYASRVGGTGSNRLAVLFTDITARKQAEETVRASGARNSFLVTLADTIRPLSDPVAVQAEASRVLGERLGATRVVYFEIRGDEYVIERDYTAGVRPLAGRYPVASFGPDLLASLLAGRTVVEADATTQPGRSQAERAAFAAIQVRGHVDVPLVKDGRFVAGMTVHIAEPRDWTPEAVALVEDTAERTWAAVGRVRAEAEVARLAAAAERERRLFAVVLDGTPDFIYTFDLDGRFVYVNAALLALWAKRLDEAVGRDFRDLDYPPALADRLQRQIRQVIDTKQPVRDDTPYTSRLGERMYEYIFVPVVGENGEVEAVAGSTRDITDRKRAEAELRRLAADLSEAGRRKDEFLAILAHELRNPLAPLRNGLEVIRLAGATGTVEQARAMMDRQVSLLVRLVDDLLDVSRITRGKMELRTERVDVRGVVAAALETSRAVVEQSGHELTVELPDAPVLVEGDSTRLAQVISNLLNNSAKYTHRGGHVRLTVRRDGGWVEVTVADDGVGIPPAMLGRVFEMFTQVDRTLEKTTGGLGIGLSLVKGLVEMHGGTVESRSEGEGRGSEFVVRLPLTAEARGKAAGDGATDAGPAGTRRILVVDDNSDAADSLGQLLGMLGNEVRTAYDGESGVRVAEEFRPAVIFMDIGMPKLNGYEAARRIRDQPWGRRITLVALTGWGQEADRRRTAAAGFVHHLVKPVEISSLTALLAEVRSNV